MELHTSRNQFEHVCIPRGRENQITSFVDYLNIRPN